MTSYEDSILRRQSEKWDAGARPPAWSSSRDELCECTDWLKNRQGGFYTIGGDKNPQLKGVYIDAYPGARAYMDTEIIVTSLHGEATAVRVATAGKEMEPRF